MSENCIQEEIVLHCFLGSLEPFWCFEITVIDVLTMGRFRDGRSVFTPIDEGDCAKRLTLFFSSFLDGARRIVLIV